MSAQGAGSYAAGRGPAGAAPVAAPSVPQVAAAQAVIRFDPTSKRHVQLDSGLFDTTTSTDQAMVAQWTTKAGAIPAARDVGYDLSDVTSLGDPGLQQKVGAALTNAIAPLVAAGDARVVATRANVPTTPRGRLEVIGTYANLRLAAIQSKKA